MDNNKDFTTEEILEMAKNMLGKDIWENIFEQKEED